MLSLFMSEEMSSGKRLSWNMEPRLARGMQTVCLTSLHDAGHVLTEDNRSHAKIDEGYKCSSPGWTLDT